MPEKLATKEHPYDVARHALLFVGRSVANTREKHNGKTWEYEEIWLNGVGVVCLKRVYKNNRSGPFIIESWDVFQQVTRENSVSATMARVDDLINQSQGSQAHV